jgi:hypothetical protein
MVCGPLFQQASEVSLCDLRLRKNVTLEAALSLPESYVYKPRHGCYNFEKAISPEIGRVMKDFGAGSSIPYHDTGCRSHCSTSIKVRYDAMVDGNFRLQCVQQYYSVQLSYQIRATNEGRGSRIN